MPRCAHASTWPPARRHPICFLFACAGCACDCGRMVNHGDGSHTEGQMLRSSGSAYRTSRLDACSTEMNRKTGPVQPPNSLALYEESLVSLWERLVTTLGLHTARVLLA